VIEAASALAGAACVYHARVLAIAALERMLQLICFLFLNFVMFCCISGFTHVGLTHSWKGLSAGPLASSPGFPSNIYVFSFQALA
jgi:hypothetical protein